MFARAFFSTAFVLALPVLAAANTLARADAASCDSDLVCCQVIVTDISYGYKCLKLGSGDGYLCGGIKACCSQTTSEPDIFSGCAVV